MVILLCALTQHGAIQADKSLLLHIEQVTTPIREQMQNCADVRFSLTKPAEENVCIPARIIGDIIERDISRVMFDQNQGSRFLNLLLDHSMKLSVFQTWKRYLRNAGLQT